MNQNFKFTEGLEDLAEGGSGDVGVEMENDDGALIVAVGEDVGGRNSKLGPHGPAADNPRRPRRRRRRRRDGEWFEGESWGEDGRVVNTEAMLVLHVLVTYGIKSCMSSPQIIEMDGHDSFPNPLHLNGSYIAKHLQFPSYPCLAHVGVDGAEQDRPRRRLSRRRERRGEDGRLWWWCSDVDWWMRLWE